MSPPFITDKLKFMIIFIGTAAAAASSNLEQYQILTKNRKSL
jgi:hypothetical protein